MHLGVSTSRIPGFGVCVKVGDRCSPKFRYREYGTPQEAFNRVLMVLTSGYLGYDRGQLGVPGGLEPVPLFCGHLQFGLRVLGLGVVESLFNPEGLPSVLLRYWTSTQEHQTSLP